MIPMHTRLVRAGVIVGGVLIIGVLTGSAHALTIINTGVGEDIVSAIIEGRPLETATETVYKTDTTQTTDDTSTPPPLPLPTETRTLPEPPLVRETAPIPPQPQIPTPIAPSRVSKSPAVQTQTARTPSTTTPAVKPNQASQRILQPVVPHDAPTVRPRTEATHTTTSRTQREHLETLSTSINNVRTETRRIERAVETAVSHNIDAALAQVDVSTTRQFNPDERERVLTTLKSHVAHKQEQLSSEVRATLAENRSAADGLPSLAPVLKSSLNDIALLIKQESGVDVDLSPQARAISSAVAEATPGFLKARAELLQREGLDLYTDTDADGISDYDETHLYFTDPRNAFTAGGALTDGERVLLGFDPLSTSTRRIPVESPRATHETTVHLFEVERIARTTEGTAASTSTSEQPHPRGLSFAGRGLPNSFVTLYVFSTPVVVTLKTDAEGRWEYTLDTELEDGEHELYVATVDNTGRILAKSPAVPFTQTAEAVEFTPLLIASASPDPDPVDVLNNNFIAVAVFAVLAFTVGALAILGMHRRRSTDSPTTLA